eukprot:CAMPEP_0183712376 /NCGR_PEP_ID=MMETSP0737-20130205/7520_1 /TAXON_ID=385413 /ORGANISM="Thalassiosira miniscula, Strain CCMP1093" /LENGTH=129 /DNA_ID=CAMNT_0025940977 /DNA_START=76 /DNA_END=462 /DNA_ORIENTATION=-
MARTRRVHFAPEYDIQFFEHHSEVDAIWYNEEDYRAMRIAKKEAVRDVQRRAIKLRAQGVTDSADLVDDFDSGALVGIEKNLSPRIIKKTQASTILCRHAVMNEQERQEKHNEPDQERLASVARRYSEW